MRKVDVHNAIIRDTIADVADEQVLLHALVLHTHSIVLRDDVILEDAWLGPAEQQVVLAPLTWNHLAELLASARQTPGERRSPDFWFFECRRVVPYEAFDDVPEEVRDGAIAARRSIECHRLVARVIED